MTSPFDKLIASHVGGPVRAGTAFGDATCASGIAAYQSLAAAENAWQSIHDQNPSAAGLLKAQQAVVDAAAETFQYWQGKLKGEQKTIDGNGQCVSLIHAGPVQTSPGSGPPDLCAKAKAAFDIVQAIENAIALSQAMQFSSSLPDLLQALAGAKADLTKWENLLEEQGFTLDGKGKCFPLSPKGGNIAGTPFEKLHRVSRRGEARVAPYGTALGPTGEESACAAAQKALAKVRNALLHLNEMKKHPQADLAGYEQAVADAQTALLAAKQKLATFGYGMSDGGVCRPFQGGGPKTGATPISSPFSRLTNRGSR